MTGWCKRVRESCRAAHTRASQLAFSVPPEILRHRNWSPAPPNSVSLSSAREVMWGTPVVLAGG